MADDRKALLAQADRALQRGDMREAVSVYRRLLAGAANDVVLLQRLGDALARAGSDTEARDVFRQLADAYWSAGHKARAMAALRRAVRLGPPDPGVLALLGNRLLEQGLVADARDPLLEAARAAEAKDDRANAGVLFARIAEQLPRDLASREGLVRLADKRDGPGPRAAARVELASARLRNGDTETAFLLIAESLEIDRSHVPVFERLADLLGHLPHDARPVVPDHPRNLTEDGATAWIIIRHAFLHRSGQPQFDVSALHDLLGGAKDLAPWPRLWIGRLLVAADDLAAAERSLIELESAAATNAGLARQLVAALSSLVERAPSSQAALDALLRLSAAGERTASATGSKAAATTDRVSSQPRTVTRDERRARHVIRVVPGDDEDAATGIIVGNETPVAPVQAEADDAEPLSVLARSKLLEAQAFLGQGLEEQARYALAAIPASETSHPSVVALAAQLVPAAPPRPPSRAATRPASTDDDETFVILDDDDTIVATPPSKSVPPHPASDQHGTAPQSVIALDAPRPAPETVEAPEPGVPAPSSPPRRPGPADVDLGKLEHLITRVVDPGDAEMGYQMALGLAEMGLGEQAIPLLEQALADPKRRVDALVLLVRVRLSRGEERRAYEEALVVYEGSEGLAPGLQAELFALLADLAHRTGRDDDARLFLAELLRLQPGHPAAAGLRDRIPPSRS